MINKIYIFNENGETRIERVFKETINNKQIQEHILKESNTNFIKINQSETIIYKRYNKIIISLVTERENEIYCLSLISLFMELLNRQFQNITELHFIYHFKDIYDLLDKFIVGGFVIETDPDKIVEKEVVSLNKTI